VYASLVEGEILMRGYVLFAAMLLSYLAAYAVDGFNMPGLDYANFNADSSFICRDSCGGDSRCQGWTWVKPGIQGPSGHCWLKFKLPALVKDNCCSSGPRNFISQREMKAEARTNRPGLDYKHFDTDSWAACEKACAADTTCAAWSYVNPGIQGPRGRCWLKGRVPNPVTDANVISGVKYKPASVLFDNSQ
jgi:hypothetical protein